MRDILGNEVQMCHLSAIMKDRQFISRKKMKAKTTLSAICEETHDHHRQPGCPLYLAGVVQEDPNHEPPQIPLLPSAHAWASSISLLGLVALQGRVGRK
jgi:hypothetical protein